MVSWSTYYDPIYRKIGVSADLTIGDNTDEQTFGLTVIDKTSGVEFAMGDVSVTSVKPACAIRVKELTARGIELDQLRRARIAFNGNTWRVENKMLKPSPAGEALGEVYLILIQDRS